ncbi:MAG: hypothetical protein RR348_03900, partial [Clostridia bacterium]
ELTTNLKKSIKVTMDDSNNVQLVHSFKNCGDTSTSKISLWTLNVLDKGAVATLKLSQQDTGFLPNRNIVFWSYDNIKDSRLECFDDKIVLTWKNIEQAFKIGSTITQPVEVVTKGLKFSIKSQYDEGGEYPDFCCNTELYTNNLMMEIETISSLAEIGAGQSKTHIEEWTLKEV